MSVGGIERILRKIRENSTDENIRDFLEGLVWEEFESPTGWYKDYYKKKIEKYVKKEGVDDN